MGKITYLIGAGASAQTLPIVNEIPKEIGVFKKTFLNILEDENLKKEIENNRGLLFSKKDFIEGIDDLLFNLPKHASIDTYAKKLRITGNSKKIQNN